MMTRYSSHFAAIACVVIPGLLLAGQPDAAASMKQELAALRATMEDLRAQVATLSDTVRLLQLERHQHKIREINAELEAVRVENARLADLDQARLQDLRELDELLARGEVTPSDRSQMEGARVELAVGRARELAMQSEAALVRESELLRRLKTEEESVKRLDKALTLTKGNTQ